MYPKSGLTSPTPQFSPEVSTVGVLINHGFE
jgi:hypothetical protein